MTRWPVHAAGSPSAVVLADLAKAGDLDGVLALLERGGPSLSVNQWRPGGTSFFTPLHQAAWHGAPVDVVERLVSLGAWRTLPDARGRTPRDVALSQGHTHLAAALEAAPVRTVAPDVLARLDARFTSLVVQRTQREWVGTRVRPLASVVLTELDDGALWYPVPGMYGGFSVRLREDHLYVESWCRVVQGSGQAHLVTPTAVVLVRQGFV